MVVKRVSDLDIRRRNTFTAIGGNLSDSFVDEDLCSYTFEQQLFMYLMNEGYDRIYYYSRAKGYGWYTYDRNMLTLLVTNSSEGGNDTPHKGRRVPPREGKDKKNEIEPIRECKESSGRTHYSVSDFWDVTLVKYVLDIMCDHSYKSIVYFSSLDFRLQDEQGFVSGLEKINDDAPSSQLENKILVRQNSKGVFDNDYFKKTFESSENVFLVGSPDRKECENWLNL